MSIPMIDWLSMTIDIYEYESSATEVISLLEEAKNEASGLRSRHNQDKVYIDIGNQTFEVFPNGQAGYAYILHNKLFEMRLAKFRNSQEENYPVFVHLKSELLWSMGPEYAWAWIITWISENIGAVKSDKLNRIDLCCHTDDYDFKLTDAERFKGRHRAQTIHLSNRDFTGLDFGSRKSGTIFARIYNKTKEVKDKRNKLWFFDVWIENGLNPDNVWNVEFELKRDVLKQMKVEDCYTAFENLKTIWTYLTCKWLVMTDDSSDRPERCNPTREWASIHQAFVDYKGAKMITRERQKSRESDCIVPSGMGYLTTYAALNGLTDPYQIAISFIKDGITYLNRKGKDVVEMIEAKTGLYLLDGGEK